MISANESLMDRPEVAGLDASDACGRLMRDGVALLTGGIDRPYAFGLTRALASKGIKLDVIAGRELECTEICGLPEVTFLALHVDKRKASGVVERVLRNLSVYGRIVRYAAGAKPRIFHILWNCRLQLFDRTVLMLYYKMLGKKIVLTAHNVNIAVRDANDSLINRLSLKIQYRLCDHIFVHTDKMKADLVAGFGVKDQAVTVIPFGINNSVPDTGVTAEEAKRQLGLEKSEKVILFFGRIRPYKGLEHLVEAFRSLAEEDRSYRLIIAGEPKKEAVDYWHGIERTIEGNRISDCVIREARFIRDDETELYFKAADVLVLPYVDVFQSGVLFLAYNFGLPVVATDVGSLRGDIIEGETGYVCRAGDPSALVQCLTRYFDSELFAGLPRRRSGIKAFAEERNSWSTVSEQTCAVYERLLTRSDGSRSDGRR
jgi:glycosyltransferase involved in cell wall biosynthesis